MIEIMVVVLVIGLLISIALPTFLGARERAQDRGVQTDVRNAFLAERVYHGRRHLHRDTLCSTTSSRRSTTWWATFRRRSATSTCTCMPAPTSCSCRAGASGHLLLHPEIDGGGAQFASSSGCGVADGRCTARAGSSRR